MALSSTKRARPKRSDPTIKTVWQEIGALGNCRQDRDYSNGMGMCKNDFYNCRAFEYPSGARYNNNDLTEEGWPITNNWRLVIQDGRGPLPGGDPLINDGTQPGVLTKMRWDIGDVVRCKVRSSNSTANIFPLGSINAATFQNIVRSQTEPDVWYFDLRITGRTPILRGTLEQESISIRELIIPRPGHTIKDIEEPDETGIWNPHWLDWMKQFTSLRVMSMQDINGNSSGPLGEDWQRCVWDPRLRPVFGLNRVEIRDRTWISPQNLTVRWDMDVETIVDLLNAIRARPGSVLNSVWYNFPWEYISCWDKSDPIYGGTYDAQGNYTTDYSTILAQVLPESISAGYTTYGDEFVYQTSKYLRDNLHPSMGIIFELGNELWNDGFRSSWTWTTAQSLEKYAGNAAPFFLNSGGGYLDNPLTRKAKLHAYMTKRVGDIAKAVFAERPERPKPQIALGSFTSNTDNFTRDPIKYIEALTGQPANQSFDILAVATYVIPNNPASQDFPDLAESYFTDLVGYPEHPRGGSPRGEPPYYPNPTGLKWQKEFCTIHNIELQEYETGWDYAVGSVPDSSLWKHVSLLLDENFGRPFVKQLITMIAELGSKARWYGVTPGYWGNDNRYNFNLTTGSDYKTVEFHPTVRGYRDALVHVLDPKNTNAAHKLPTEVGEVKVLETRFEGTTNENKSPRFFGPYLQDNFSKKTDSLYANSYVGTPEFKLNNPSYASWTENPKVWFAWYVPESGVYDINLFGGGGRNVKASKYVAGDFAESDILVSDPISVSEMIVGSIYKIVTVGDTDWVACGSLVPSPQPGYSFIATAPGTGTGIVQDASTLLPDPLSSGFSGWKISKRRYSPSENLAYEYLGKFMLSGGSDISAVKMDGEDGNPIRTTFERGWYSIALESDVPGTIYGRSGQVQNISTDTKYWSSILPPAGMDQLISQSTSSLALNLSSNLTLTLTENNAYGVGETVYFKADNIGYTYYGTVLDYNNVTFELTITPFTFTYDRTQPTAAPWENAVVNSWEIGRCRLIDSTPGSGYSSLSNIVVTVPPPELTGGIQAVARVVELDIYNGIKTVEMTVAGSGYPHPIAVTFTDLAPVSPPTIPVSSIEGNKKYEIVDLGTTTDWTSAGVPSGTTPVVGLVFISVTNPPIDLGDGSVKLAVTPATGRLVIRGEEFVGTSANNIVTGDTRTVVNRAITFLRDAADALVLGANGQPIVLGELPLRIPAGIRKFEVKKIS